MSNDLVAAPQGGSVAPPSFSDALSSAAGYALAEKSDATRRAYRSDFRHFSAWCASAGADPMPAGTATVAAYLASLADSGLKVSTITRRAAAIGYAHRLAQVDPPTLAEPVKAVLRGIRRKLGIAVNAKAPATAKVIAAMLKRMPATLSGKRDRALLLIGFAAALRRSELVDLKVNDIERASDGIIVHIRRSKTDQEGEGQQVAVPAGGKLGVIEALNDWLQASCITQGPLFRAVAKGDRVQERALTGQAVARIIKKWAAAAKLDPAVFSGHSVRAGFVTSALQSGADLLKVMDITRHREVATLKVYDRRAQAFKNHAGKGFL